jgi:hypothetical protein
VHRYGIGCRNGSVADPTQSSKEVMRIKKEIRAYIEASVSHALEKEVAIQFWNAD